MFKPNQAFRKTTIYNGESTHMPVTVTVHKKVGEDSEGETMWRIWLHETGKTITVPASDLSPQPDEPMTLPERFEALTSGFESPLVMCAAVEAICRYAEQMTDNEAEVLKSMERGMIHGPAWIECAKRAAAIVDTK